MNIISTHIEILGFRVCKTSLNEPLDPKKKCSPKYGVYGGHIPYNAI